MLMRALLSHGRAATAALLLLLPAACDSPAGLVPGDGPGFNRSVYAHTGQEKLLKDVRRATARFHSTTQAASAGYGETHHCVPQMGFHWVNGSLVDPVFDPRQPEVILYVPGPNGQPKLVAVEYIVIDTGQARPSFGGQPFDVGGTPIAVPHWSLHVWLYEDNPNGIFTARNPEASCS